MRTRGFEHLAIEMTRTKPIRINICCVWTTNNQSIQSIFVEININMMMSSVKFIIIMYSREKYCNVEPINNFLLLISIQQALVCPHHLPIFFITSNSLFIT